MAEVAIAVRAAQSFDSMTAEGQAGAVNGWLNGAMPLAEVYPRIVQVASNAGITVQAHLRDELEVASTRETKDGYVLRADYYRKSIGAYIIATLGLEPKEAVKLAAGYTAGWSSVTVDKIDNTLNDIDSMSKGQLVDAVDANLASQVTPTPGRTELADKIRKGKFNLGDITEEILALLEL